MAEIERTLAIRLTRYKESGEVSEDQGSAPTKSQPPRWRSFGPGRGAGRRLIRRAV